MDFFFVLQILLVNYAWVCQRSYNSVIPNTLFNQEIWTDLKVFCDCKSLWDLLGQNKMYNNVTSHENRSEQE